MLTDPHPQTEWAGPLGISQSCPILLQHGNTLPATNFMSHDNSHLHLLWNSKQNLELHEQNLRVLDTFTGSLAWLVTQHFTIPSLIHTWKPFIQQSRRYIEALLCFNVCVFTCNLRGALGRNMVSIMVVIMAMTGHLQSIIKPLCTTLQCDWNNNWFKLTTQRGEHSRTCVFYKLQKKSGTAVSKS